MKLIHTADIHLASKMDSVFPGELASELQRELCETFRRLAEYASKNGIRAVLLCGDVFDSDRPFKRDKTFFYSVIKNTPSVNFYYLRGNHDTLESYSAELPNLMTFSHDWQSYEETDPENGEKVYISGIELSDENYMSCYRTLSLKPDVYNIVMMHGQVSGGINPGCINIPELRNRNIDYLALGHIHTASEEIIDRRGKYGYSGCLQGRGFDESGRKGFRIIDTSTKTASFVPFALSDIVLKEADVTGTESENDAIAKVTNILSDEIRRGSSVILKLTLKGKVQYDSGYLTKSLQTALKDSFRYVKIKNDVITEYGSEISGKSVSVINEFRKTVYESANYTEEERQAILRTGLAAISGEPLL